MYKKHLDNQMKLEEMTRREFRELMSEWEMSLKRSGMTNVNVYTNNLLKYHIENDVKNANEKDIITHYLKVAS